jgi:hypothetical protein
VTVYQVQHAEKQAVPVTVDLLLNLLGHDAVPPQLLDTQKDP